MVPKRMKVQLELLKEEASKVMTVSNMSMVHRLAASEVYNTSISRCNGQLTLIAEDFGVAQNAGWVVGDSCKGIGGRE